MSELFTVKAKINAEELEKLLYIDETNKAQMFLTSEIIRLADDYTPFRTGALKNISLSVSDDYKHIYYNAPYARYLWYGKLMVDPITRKGAFYNPKTGRFWSRPRTAKVLTDRDLNFNQSPPRGAKWIDRMWEVEGEQVLDSLKRFIIQQRG